MSALEIGQKLVELCKAGKYMEAIDKLYGESIVSIEGQDAHDMPARIAGIEAVRGKNEWWGKNHEVHALEVVGPFCGRRPDQFAVLFDIDVTNKPSGERTQLREVALYTIDGGKIVEEAFLYQMS